MKFTDIKPNPKDYSRKDLVKAFQDFYRYTGELAKLVQTPFKLPFYFFQEEPYLIFDPKLETVTEESINNLLDTESISDDTIQETVCNTRHYSLDSFVKRLNNHYLKEQLGDHYAYLKFFSYPYVQDALANRVTVDQDTLNTRLKYIRFNSFVNKHIHIFSQDNKFYISPSNSNIVLEDIDGMYTIKTRYDNFTAINDNVVNAVIPELKKDLETIKAYVDSRPKQLTKTVAITPIPEEYHHYIKTVDTLKVTFPTKDFNDEHGPYWLTVYKGNPETTRIPVTLAIKNNHLLITHDFKPEESLLPFSYLTANTSEAKRNIDEQLQDAFKTVYFRDQCAVINQNDALTSYLVDLDKNVRFEAGDNSYALHVDYSICTKIIDYHKSGTRLLTLRRDRDYDDPWTIVLRQEDASFDSIRKTIEEFKSLF